MKIFLVIFSIVATLEGNGVSKLGGEGAAKQGVAKNEKRMRHPLGVAEGWQAWVREDY